MSSRFRRPSYKTGEHDRRGYDVEAATPRVERPKKRQRFSAYWLVPLVALLLGASLAFNTYKDQGPLITIQFNSAEGLVAGKTPIRYRNVNIGLVEKITLNDDLDTVMVEARMSVDSRRFLNNHARFWVVKPRVGTSGVSGLGTLLSGAYIQVNSLVGNAYEDRFVGLEKPPLTEEGAPGVRINLQAEQAGYVSIGSPVYYRQVKVGRIEAQRFLPGYQTVEFTIFVESPHHKIIRNITKFWNVSGVALNVNANGLSVRTPSLEGLAQGGVSFDIIEEYEFPYQVEDGLMYDESSQSVRVPVHIEFQPERLLGVKGVDIDEVNQTIARNLQAKLQMGNLLTGQLFVSLEDIEGDPAPLKKSADGVPILPSVKSDLGQLTEGVQTALAGINELPLEELVTNASDTVAQAQQLLADFNGLGLAARVNGTFGSVDGAVEEYAKLATTVGTDISRLTEKVKLFIATADESIEGIAPDSPLYYNMLNTLKDLQQAARGVEAFSESVEKKPEEFLFGK